MKQISVLVTFFFLLLKVYSQEFITRWDLSSPPVDTINFTIESSGPVHYSWETIPAFSSGSGVITGTDAKITGMPVGSMVRLKIDTTNFRRFLMFSSLNAIHLKDVEQWGAVHWTSMNASFLFCPFLNISATDIPDLSSVTSTLWMFKSCYILNGPANIGDWNMEMVQDIGEMFAEAKSFNQNIGNWNTGSVQNMRGVFLEASSFNQDIGNWNTGMVQDMRLMFYGSNSFNQNIGNWNTGSVKTMLGMFRDATSFNQDIGSWNTSAVTDMSQMFFKADSFNQNIGNWNTSSVKKMALMFRDAISFDQSIGNWNTSSVNDMSLMFRDAISFDQNIGNWKLSAGTNMSQMFDNCGMNCSNYSSTLSGWRENSYIPPGITLGASNIYYDSSAVSARSFLINSKGWSIIGDAPCWTTSASGTPAPHLTCNIIPNPVKDLTILHIPVTNRQKATITVYNSLGSMVFLDKIDLYPGDNTYNLNAGKWPNGVYVVSTKTGTTQFVNRIIVSR